MSHSLTFSVKPSRYQINTITIDYIAQLVFIDATNSCQSKRPNKGRHATAPRPFINDYAEEENESEVDISDYVSERPKDMRITVHSYRALKDRIEEGEEDNKVSLLKYSDCHILI